MVNWRRRSLCKLLFLMVAAISALGLYSSYKRNAPEPLGFPPPEYLHVQKSVEQAKPIPLPLNNFQPPSNSDKRASNSVQFVSERRQRCDALKGTYNSEKVEQEMKFWETSGNIPPNPIATIKNYKDSQTMKELDKLLNALKFEHSYRHKFIMLLAANERYANQVFNWLCVLRRNVPELLPQVLVLSLDGQLHSQLVNLDVMSVLVDPMELFNSTILDCSNSQYATIWMLRTLVVHHIVHYGMNVAVIDADAMVMKDPTYLYTVIGMVSKVDALFGMGKYPYDLGAAWGFTGCMGTSFFKSSPGTKLLLGKMSLIDPFVTDDQVRLNRALNQSGVQWPSLQGEGSLGCTIGQTPDNSLRVGLLPEGLVCRYRCKRSFNTPNVVDMDAVYLVHPLLLKSKKRESLQQMNLWYLNDEGEDNKGNSTNGQSFTNHTLSTICL